MRGKLFASALGLVALSLAACDHNDGEAANRGLCYDFRANHAPATPAAPAAVNGLPATTGAPPVSSGASPVDDCVRRWAYSLAPSRDGAQVVADAAVAACAAPLTRWNEQVLGQPETPQAPSLTTGEPTNPLAEHNNLARSRALLYVVQARAGHCAPPPATNGIPQGVTG